jgi:hypothetical protein
MSAVVTMERVVDKLRELEARIRALERQAEDNRTLDDIRCSISMLAETVSSGAAAAAAPARPRQLPQRPAAVSAATTTEVYGAAALADPRFRSL